MTLIGGFLVGFILAAIVVTAIANTRIDNRSAANAIRLSGLLMRQSIEAAAKSNVTEEIDYDTSLEHELKIAGHFCQLCVAENDREIEKISSQIDRYYYTKGNAYERNAALSRWVSDGFNPNDFDK